MIAFLFTISLGNCICFFPDNGLNLKKCNSVLVKLSIFSDD